MKSVKLRIFYLCLLCINPALALEEANIQIASISENDYFGEIPQVLTIARIRQAPSDAPSASTIIDRETIRAAGIIDLPEVFRLVPGFYVGVNAGFITNTNHVVSYHGMSDAYAGRMQVLIDGRSVYQPYYGGVQWSELPISVEDIDRIEVTRGPNSASYGANSFLGVINIITRDPTGASANRVSAAHGNGRNQAFFHHSGKNNDLNYRFTAGFTEDDGLSQRDDYKKTYLFNTRANYFINAANDIEFQFGLSTGKRTEGLAADDALLFKPGRTKDILNHYQLIKWNHSFSNDNHFYLEATHNYSDHDDSFFSNDLSPFNAILPIPLASNFKFINNSNKIERYNLEAEHTFKLSEDAQIAWGGSIRHDRVFAPLWLNSDKDQRFNLQRLFVQGEWRANNTLTFNSGLMIEHNSFNATNFTPRASINYHLQPNQTLRFGVSTATRTPSFLEGQFSDELLFPSINPALTYLAKRFDNSGKLDPERITSFDIGYIAQFDQLSIDAKIFHDKIKKVVDAVNSDTFTTPPGLLLVSSSLPDVFINGGNINMTGFETQLKWSLANHTKLIANYAYLNATSENGISNNFYKYANASAKHTASFLLMSRLNSLWDASFSGYYTSPVTALGDGDFVGFNHRFDARLARKFTLNKTNGEISLNIFNLTDEHNKEFAEYNIIRRRAFINVNLDF